MFKKISFLFIFFILSGCTIAGPKSVDNINILEKSEISKDNFGEATNFRVGMLLPLSGKAAKQGQGLRNAALMALEDVNNPNMLLQFYDTKSSAAGAKAAIENAISQKSQLIIGPLMAEEVKAISERSVKKDIPVIAFSTNNDVLQDGVYSIGLLVDEQVERIVNFAAKKNRKKFALLVPDNNTGIAVAKAAILSAKENEVKITSIAFYPPETSDFSETLKGLTEYDKRYARVQNIKKSLEAKAEKGNVNAAKILSRLKAIDTLGDVDFDAIIIPEQGTKLKSATAMLGYYDVANPKVKILGTSIWETSKLNHENGLINAWYPAISRNHSSYFVNKYSKVFGEKPNSIYSFAYDAVALASSITNSEHSDLNKSITNPDGYIGINGAFRIFADGTNQHSLEVLEIRRNGDVIIDHAPKKFSTKNYLSFRELIVDDNYVAPKIFGKDKSLAQSLIYGYQLPAKHLPTNKEIEPESEIIRKSLAEHKIVIP